MHLKLSELQRMTFNLRDQIMRIYCCCRKLRKIDLKREMLYLDGTAKIYEALDVVNMLELVRKVRLMERLVLSKHHVALLSVSNGNLLDMNPAKPDPKPPLLEHTFITDENKQDIEEAVDELIDSAANGEKTVAEIDAGLIKDITEYNVVNFNGSDFKGTQPGHKRGNTAASDSHVIINSGTPEI